MTEFIKKKRERPPKCAKADVLKKSHVIPKSCLPTKRIFICSPLKGNIEKNMERARIYCRFAFESGFVPICPQIFYPQFLSDDCKNERAAGMKYGMESMWQARQIWVFGESITDGMREEISLAKQLKIPIRYFDCDMEEVK